jgi:cytochrome c-type biogenesis protein CcmH/NrfF
MDLQPASLLVAVVAFAIAFGVAKWITVRRRRRKSREQLQHASEAESRQVRRSRERRGRH